MSDQTPAPPPNPLDLYRLAVQHPLAEVDFIEKAWGHYRGAESEPVLLREDFAGTAAVAAAWVQSGRGAEPTRRAFAVELDPVTATWAQDTWCELGPDLQIYISDVIEMHTAPADVTVALNFSVLIYHDQAALLGYLRHARAMLDERGLLILDLFGGSGSRVAQARRIQTRRIVPDEGAFDPFDYAWEQREYDPMTEKIDCRIHFTLADGMELNDVFVYDWRLWRPEAVIELARQAGFQQAELWADTPDQPGRYVPLARDPVAEDWVGYLVCAV
ncbi:MAG: hypothetical protein AAGH88_09550 [Planctomycetota bacterium]